MRFDNARNVVDTLLGIAFRTRKPVAFADAKRLPDFGFGSFMQPVKIDQADAGAFLRKRAARQTHE
jgi:hypothetical protein